MTHEDLLAAINAANKPLLDKLNAVETELATVKNAKRDASTGDPMDEIQKVRAQAKAESDAEMTIKLRKAKTDTMSIALSGKTKTPVSLVRKKLDSFKSEEAMDLYYENAMKAAEEDVKLGIEREHGDSPDLEAEFKAFKENYPENKQTFNEYKRLAKSLTSEGLQARTERHTTRGVVAVREGVEAFA